MGNSPGDPKSSRFGARENRATAVMEPPRSPTVDIATRARTRLWDAYRRRSNDDTRNRLVEHYQPHLREIVRRFALRLPKRVDRGDLDTAANVGLMSAIEGFDPNRGVRFEIYCELRVRGALLDELRSQDWLPRSYRAQLALQRRTIERLSSLESLVPQDEDVAAAMAMPLDDYMHVFGLGLLDTPLGNGGDADGGAGGGLGIDIVADTHSDAPGEKLSRDEIWRLVSQRLTRQEYQLVYLRYWEELSMRAIGAKLRLSESRVCKLHARLMERLKDRFRVGAED